jgi:hypothetical protein
MITTCFARAAQRWTSRICVHVLFTFQEVTPISKTRNQLMVKAAHTVMSCCSMTFGQHQTVSVVAK